MQRDRLLLTEMAAAASRIVTLINNRSLDEFVNDGTVQEAVLWNFTVLGDQRRQTCLASPHLNAPHLTPYATSHQRTRLYRSG